MRISDWSSDVCSSDLLRVIVRRRPWRVSSSVRYSGTDTESDGAMGRSGVGLFRCAADDCGVDRQCWISVRDASRSARGQRSEEHTSELQSLMRISYAVFCLKKKKHKSTQHASQLDHTNQHATIHQRQYATTK